LHLDLAQRLKLATRELHTEVERSGVMAALLGGRLERAGYVALLRNLHAIYAALERSLAAAAGEDLIAPLELQALARGPRLADDLDHLHGPGWAGDLPLTAAASAYAERVRVAAPAALVAHAYVRYLGDLSGGQLLARLVSGRYGLAGGAGTRFYDFGGEVAASALKRDLRAALAALAPAADEAATIVDEACWAFRQHRALFEELDRLRV
jgi:heme oxygenase